MGRLVSYNVFRTLHKGKYSRIGLINAWRIYKATPCYVANEGFFKILRAVTKLRPPGETNRKKKNFQQLAEKRMKWLLNKGFDYQPSWFCSFLHEALDLPPNYRVMSYLGSGVNSVVLEVTVGGRNRCALKITPAQGASAEHRIHRKLHRAGLAPAVHSRRVHNKMEYVLMDAVVGTLAHISDRAVVDLDPRPWARQILEVTSKLEKLGVVHGDLHINNLVLLGNRQLGLIDFDRSEFCDNWEEYGGLDLAFLVNQLQMPEENEPERSTKFYTSLAKKLLPHVPDRWKTKGGKLDADLIDAFYE
jgi:tRNA A-37 threonylcarbamoyl transferase component Bud32